MPDVQAIPMFFCPAGRCGPVKPRERGTLPDGSPSYECPKCHATIPMGFSVFKSEPAQLRSSHEQSPVEELQEIITKMHDLSHRAHELLAKITGT